MATYIPNLTDTGLDTPLYQPDFQFIERMMQKKSAQYEQGFSEIKSFVDQIKNAPLFAQGNAEIRDAYLQKAQEKLKTVAESDLSLAQNVESATGVLSPFWQDEDLLSDYGKSKQIITNLQKGYAMQESRDPKERAAFWQTGIDNVNISLREMKMAKRGDGSINKVQVNKYVPFYDRQEFLDKQAKEQGLKVETVTIGSGYVKTITNGDGSKEIYEEWAARQLANNPQALDVSRVQGTVDFKNKAFNIMETTGVDYTTAKTSVADQYLQSQKENNTQRLTKVTENAGILNTELQALKLKYDANPALATPQLIAEYDAKSRSLTNANNAVTYYSKQLDKYKDPNSETYQKEKNEIVNNGENFFAEYNRDQFIKNYASSRALNVQMKVEIDPVAKLNAELAKDKAKMDQDLLMHRENLQLKQQKADSSDGETGSGTGKAAKTKEQELNTPIAMGLNIQGNDPIQAYNRMVQNKIKFQDDFINSGMSLILSAGITDKVYLDYLKNALRTGSYKETPELKAEHQRLIDQKIIPANLKLGTSPSQVNALLYDHAETALTTKGLDPNINTLLLTRGTTAIQYEQLKGMEALATEAIQKDKELSSLYDENKKEFSKAVYLKNKFGTSNKNQYVGPNNQFSRGAMTEYGVVSSSYNLYEQRMKDWEKAEMDYALLIEKKKVKLGEVMSTYVKEENSFAGPKIRLRTDGAGEEERAQAIATQIMNDANLSQQEVSTDGLLPVNIEQLVKNGAPRSEIASFIKRIKSDPGAVISAIDLTKVGVRGKAGATLQFNLQRLNTYLGDKGEYSQKTLDAITASGLEFEVNTALTTIPEFDTEFISTGIDRLILNKQGKAVAPKYLQRMGMDYSIVPDDYSQRYIVNFTYPEYVNGVKETKTETKYIPMNSSLAELQTNISTRLSQIYNYNRQIENSMKPAAGTVSAWNAYKTNTNLQ